MRHHYLLTVLRLPGNVEAELSRLQELVFACSGAVSSQAFPPVVQLAGYEPSGDRRDGALLPARLPVPLVVGRPHARGQTLCMDTGLALDPGPAAVFPAGVGAARLRVLLAVLPGRAAGACPGEPIDAPEADGTQGIVDRVREAWNRGADARTMTVRRVWEEQWLVSSTSEPWWCSVDWHVTSRRAIRTARG